MQSGAALGKKMVNKNCSALFSSDVLLSSNISSANQFHVAPGMCLYATKWIPIIQLKGTAVVSAWYFSLPGFALQLQVPPNTSPENLPQNRQGSWLIVIYNLTYSVRSL